MRNIANIIVGLILFIPAFSYAADIYQWHDASGQVHFGDVVPDETIGQLVYSQDASNKAYQWTDKGVMQYGDHQPENINHDEIKEIAMEKQDVEMTQDQDYSILAQANRMTDYTRQLINTRRDKERESLEQYRLEQERQILEMEERLRTEGYGPKPYYYPY